MSNNTYLWLIVINFLNWEGYCIMENLMKLFISCNTGTHDLPDVYALWLVLDILN